MNQRIVIRPLVVPVATALLAVVSLAQPTLAAEPVPYRLGVKAGLNLGWFTGSDWTDGIDNLVLDPRCTRSANGSRVGVLGAFFLDVPVLPNLSVQPQLLIGSFGGAYNYRTLSFGVEGSIQINAVKIPLLLKPKRKVGPAGSIYGLIGPTPTFLIGEIHATERGGGSSVSTTDIPDNRFLFSDVFVRFPDGVDPSQSGMANWCLVLIDCRL